MKTTALLILTAASAAPAARAKVGLDGTRVGRAKELPAAASEKAKGGQAGKGKAEAEPPAREFPLMMVPKRMMKSEGAGK